MRVTAYVRSYCLIANPFYPEVEHALAQTAEILRRGGIFRTSCPAAAEKCREAGGWGAGSWGKYNLSPLK